MKKFLPLLLIVIAITCCTPPEPAEEIDTAEVKDLYAGFPEDFSALLKAHGGLDTWKDFGTLSYDLVAKDSTIQHQIIDLNNRKVRIEADSFLLGFDGKEVWVDPNLAAFDGKSARFYHNLFFYFFGIPFLLADPGIHYTTESRTLDGQQYSAIRTTFDQGVGDASGDIYIALLDPNSGHLFGLLYTVTYFSGEVHENFNFLKYSDWTSVEGLLLPGRLTGYAVKNDSIKNERYQTSFKNILLEKNAPEASLFSKPAGAEVDALLDASVQSKDK